MQVYKFISCKWGLEAIEKRRLKISRLDSLNDPFELLPFDLRNPAYRLALEETKREIGEGHGLQCFSRHWDNPVIWSHYAESHAGMCLGFELADEVCREVEYTDVPLRFNPKPRLELMNQMLFTKFDDWEYESEIRVWASIQEVEDDNPFKYFDEQMRLFTVILGVGCSLTPGQVNHAIGPYAYPVSVKRARRAASAFRMEIENSKHLEYDRLKEKRVGLKELLKTAKSVLPKVGRNDPCPCGGGKKYKKCHGAST